MTITGVCSFTLVFLSYWNGKPVDEFELVGIGVAIMLDCAFKLWTFISNLNGSRL